MVKGNFSSYLLLFGLGFMCEFYSSFFEVQCCFIFLTLTTITRLECQIISNVYNLVNICLTLFEYKILRCFTCFTQNQLATCIVLCVVFFLLNMTISLCLFINMFLALFCAGKKETQENVLK